MYFSECYLLCMVAVLIIVDGSLFLCNFVCDRLYIKDKPKKKTEMLLSPILSLIPEHEMLYTSAGLEYGPIK